MQKEIREIVGNEKTCTVKIELVDDNYRNLRGEIAGPPDSPYEGAKFILDVKVPEKYPFEPPTVQFVTKVWHPNICSENGRICLDILDNKWTPCMNVMTTLLSIQALLSIPEPDDPLDNYVASQFDKSQELFNQTARHWAHAYAGGPNREIELEEMVKQVKEKLCDEDYARLLLSRNNWNIESLNI